MLARLLALLTLAALTACATLVPPPAAVPARRDPQAAWAAVLERFVDDEGRTDFHALAADRADLDAYVAWVARTSPASDPALFPTEGDRLAYYLNSYNALAMYNVIAAGFPETLEGYRKVPFFFLRKLQVGGRPMTLYAYENDLIRPTGEERVHFALNCMAKACPRLPRRPFTSAGLDVELEREARRFFAEPRNLQLDPGRRTVRLSEILRFYTEDFTRKAPSLVAYANRHRADSPPIPDDYKVEFIKYDWRVNQQPPPGPPAAAPR
jgi:hypothetical protein